MSNVGSLNARWDGTESLLDCPRDRRYFDLLSFIVSNAIAGEIMAVENYSEMVHLIPDTDGKIDTVAQARQECKHIQLLASLGRTLEFGVQKRIVEPQWLNVRKHFSTAVAKGQLPACLIIQDLMTESMAILLYRTLAGEADTDSRTASVATNILKDELEHLETGIARIRAALQDDATSVHDQLVWAHHRVMPELFSMVSTSCHFLCDELQVECGTLGLDSIRTDIETIRIKALERYVETLDAVGFDATVTNRLVAGMAAYEGFSRATVGMGAG